eukprot:GEMP01019002.1.p1 GENE.GEMP01019002.1~~GEMP01019002.1.p1  ORF type:complete len:668 (+),score=117.72 GEMP01019002.1:271-2274(+)
MEPVEVDSIHLRVAPKKIKSPACEDQKLTFMQALGLNTMHMFGTGPLITIPYCVASVDPIGPHAIWGYGIACVACLCDSLVWGEIGSMWPDSGGSYIYLRELFGAKTWGRLFAFMFVWQFLLSGPAEASSGFIAIAEYLAYFSPDTVSYGYRVVISLSLLMVCLGFLVRKITDIGKATIVLWIVTILAMVYTIMAGFTDWHVSNLRSPSGAFSSGSKVLWNLAAGTRFGVYDMTGYYDINFMGSEVVNPKRTIPYSGIITCFVVGIIYILCYLAIIGSLPMDSIIHMYAEDYDGVPVGIMSVFTEWRFGSPALAYVVTLVVCVTIFGSTFAMLIGFVFVPVAAARDGYFFSFFAPKDQGEGLPLVSLGVIITLTGICCFFSLDLVIDVMTTMLCLIMFCGQSMGLMYYRYTTPKEKIPDGWKMPFYPLPCIIQFTIFFFIFITSNSAMRGTKPVLELSMLFLVLGVLMFLVRSRYHRTWPFDDKLDDEDAEDDVSSPVAVYTTSPGGHLAAPICLLKGDDPHSPTAVAMDSPVITVISNSPNNGVVSPIVSVKSSPSLPVRKYENNGVVLEDLLLADAPTNTSVKTTVVQGEDDDINVQNAQNDEDEGRHTDVVVPSDMTLDLDYDSSADGDDLGNMNGTRIVPARNRLVVREDCSCRQADCSWGPP